MTNSRFHNIKLVATTEKLVSTTITTASATKALHDARNPPMGMFARFRLAFSQGVLLCLTATAATIGSASGASGDDAARVLFTQFVAAQNAHDSKAVASLLWASPDTLWFTRGNEVRGVTAIVETLTNYYAGTWHLEPDMSHFRSTQLSEDVRQILVPVTFTRGLPGKPAEDNTFLISQTLVRTAGGWRVASIMPIANTQLK
jgi:uncharacterized protein (TIGR02246 family)